MISPLIACSVRSGALQNPPRKGKAESNELEWNLSALKIEKSIGSQSFDMEISVLPRTPNTKNKFFTFGGQLLSQKWLGEHSKTSLVRGNSQGWATHSHLEVTALSLSPPAGGQRLMNMVWATLGPPRLLVVLTMTFSKIILETDIMVSQ